MLATSLIISLNLMKTFQAPSTRQYELMDTHFNVMRPIGAKIGFRH